MLNKRISYDEKVSKLSLESKLLFTWIIPHLDVKGRFFCNSEIIKGQVCPFVKELSIKKIEKCLLEMEEVGLIIIYGNNHKYLEYIGFSKNQTITESRESPSDIPDPNQTRLKQDSSETQGEVNISKVNISKEKYERVFDKFRKTYPGTKSGLDTEFANFIKRHKDWLLILPTLQTVLIEQIAHREKLKARNEFIPQWKNLQTWINQRSWEEEYPDNKKETTLILKT